MKFAFFEAEQTQISRNCGSLLAIQLIFAKEDSPFLRTKVTPITH
jgi:hypothetical protein